MIYDTGPAIALIEPDDVRHAVALSHRESVADDDVQVSLVTYAEILVGWNLRYPDMDIDELATELIESLQNFDIGVQSAIELGQAHQAVVFRTFGSPRPTLADSLVATAGKSLVTFDAKLAQACESNGHPATLLPTPKSPD